MRHFAPYWTRTVVQPFMLNFDAPRDMTTADYSSTQPTLVLHRVQSGVYFEDDSWSDDDPAGLVWLNANLPRCHEHDRDIEGVRQRWWADGDRPAWLRGPRPYTDEDIEEARQRQVPEHVPIPMLRLHQARIGGELPDWGRDADVWTSQLG
ncbi:uncharacterized protein PFL1_01117 [Pseudozyma flocculosa PF-1]|uniref:uncharacterized protein n=1 Tax=Pseudozyma flocculosa PF-1 TaxID=1277687 RepID=UPI0004560F6B|nr:uncharacterized protein PFL1_01117 [Pseudozyma flocculosa PF-1]EPQ31785.1 hypothetical protein PFL1_01117 [Pseudozyma flocculosa PF-1]